MAYGTGKVVPPFNVDSSSISGAVNIGYTDYPRYNLENYWWNEESPDTQWSMNALFGGSSSCEESWGLYQITNPSVYGQYNNWICQGTLNPFAPGDCCPQYAPGVSYNTKMLVVWNSWDQQISTNAKSPSGNPCFASSPWINIENATPIFYQVSSSGTAPCDMDFNDYGSYPWGSIIQFANDLCGWKYTSSLSQSIGLVPGKTWKQGISDLLAHGSEAKGLIIVRNNDIRGVDLWRCRQNWNPRLLNVYPLSGSVLMSATPCSNETVGSPYDDAQNFKGHASFLSDFMPPAPYPLFSQTVGDPSSDPGNVESSESFFYPQVPYTWEVKAKTAAGLWASSTGSITIEWLMKPAWGTPGSQLYNNTTAQVGGYNNYSPGVGIGPWQPIFTRNGPHGEYSVWVDTVDSKSVAFGYSHTNNDENVVWFTSSMNFLNTDPVKGVNVWYHCAVTRNFDLDIDDEDGLKWFLNGQPFKRIPWGISTSPPFQITSSEFDGKFQKNTTAIASDLESKQWNKKHKSYYSGSLGFIRLYERPLNQYQILTNFYKSGIWADYDGYQQEIDYQYDWDGTDYYVQYSLNGGKNNKLQLMIDHGNLVSDQGYNNTTGSAIFNIRQYSSSYDSTLGEYVPNGYWSGSQHGGEHYLNDMNISQSSDGYQTYDSMNGARFYPGSDTDKSDDRNDQYAYEECHHVSCNTTNTGPDENRGNTFEGWFRLSKTTGSNAGNGTADRVIMCLDTKKYGARADWGLMYNEDGFGFWDGFMHYGLSWSTCEEYLRDRWCYIQAVWVNGGWGPAASDQGDGFILGLNGNYYQSNGGETGGFQYLKPGTDGSDFELNLKFEATHSFSFMGNWEGNQVNNASGSIAEVRWYAQHLKYSSTTNYAYGPDLWNSSIPDPGQPWDNYDGNADTPYDWLEHNWRASKNRFGMGGDASFT